MKMEKSTFRDIVKVIIETSRRQWTIQCATAGKSQIKPAPKVLPAPRHRQLN